MKGIKLKAAKFQVITSASSLISPICTICDFWSM